MADYRDIDSDNDGIPDNIELGSDPTNPVDTDNDGIPDYRDIDSDNDGIPDNIELGSNPTNPVDTDGDGVADYRDVDSDGDGLGDGAEAGVVPANPVDTDGDGIPNYRDVDSDGDAIPDVTEGAGDSDGDGIGNSIDFDPIVIAGLVLDVDTRRPVAGATVTLVDSAGNSYRVTTGPDGRFRFESSPNNPIAAGSVTLTAVKNGYSQILGTYQVNPGQQLVRNLELDQLLVPGVLAFTGSDSLNLALLALMLMTFGWLLGAGSRRRIG